MSLRDQCIEAMKEANLSDGYEPYTPQLVAALRSETPDGN